MKELNDVVILRVPVERCDSCRAPMLPAEWFKVHHVGSGLPTGVPGQLRGGGVKERAGYFAGRNLCAECRASGRGVFACALCGVSRPSSEMARRFGDDYGAEFLCGTCYETVPARRWDRKVEELTEAHQFDWE